MYNEFETFYDEIKVVNGTLRVTIPDKLVKFAGFQEGDQVKIMIRRKVAEDMGEEKRVKQNDIL